MEGREERKEGRKGWKRGGREREREREREKIVPLIHAFIGWFLYVPWPEIEPAAVAYGDDALTSWATQPGPIAWFLSIPKFLLFSSISWTPPFLSCLHQNAVILPRNKHRSIHLKTWGKAKFYCFIGFFTYNKYLKIQTISYFPKKRSYGISELLELQL